MARFILNRFLYGLAVLLGVVVLVFLLFQGLPGDPARLTMGQRTDERSLEAVRKEMGLDKSKTTQLLYYLNDLSPLGTVPRDTALSKRYSYTPLFNVSDERVFAVKSPYLRYSYQLNKPVIDMLGDALPNTIVLAVAAMFIAVVLGILFGVLSALFHNGLVDRVLVFISITGISVPSFFSAIVFQWLFAYVWSRHTGLDVTGNLFAYDLYGNPHLVLKNLLLPAITLGIRPLAIITQLTRSSMLDVMQMDFIRTARAKGLSETTVVWRHALRNSLNPVVTAITGWFAELLAGAFFIELIFGWNGIGKLTVEALNKNDFPVLMGSVLLAAVLFIVMSIITDILYGVIDPRIRKE